jgi:hypothetical protein
MKVVFATLLLCLSLGSGAGAAAQSNQVTGIDAIHAQRREAGRLCMTSHEHAGEGSMPSRRGAEAAGNPSLAGLHGLGVRVPLGQVQLGRWEAHELHPSQRSVDMPDDRAAVPAREVGRRGQGIWGRANDLGAGPWAEGNLPLHASVLGDLSA